MVENKWDQLARRMHMSREFVKRAALFIHYGGKIDPWLDHLLHREIRNVFAIPMYSQQLSNPV
jgi:hypothetical protein